MKPYKRISSQNLGLLLLLARITAVLGIILFVISIIAILFMFIGSGFHALTTSLVFIPMSVSILFISGIMAAIVAFEENYRIRTEYLVREDET
jgi:hypothetical protein